MRRLKRASSRGAQLVKTFALAVLLGGLAAFALTRPAPLIVKIVGGAFGVFALLLLYAAIHQLFALRTAETIVECDVDEFRRGRDVRLRFVQPGNGSFESLRANLVGDEHWTEWIPRHRKRVRKHQHIATVNLFDSGAFEAPFDTTVTVRVPNDLPRASVKDRQERWRLEVWGKVRGRADVQHVFPLRLL